MTLRARLQRAPLLGFLALTFAWSWACALLLPLAVMLLAAGLHVALDGDMATAPASGRL